ncbi:MAG: RNA methyltransferase [Dehalococcoidia bacterium]
MSKDYIEPDRPLRWYRKLSTGKGRLAAEAFTVEGERAVAQIARVCPGAIMEIVALAEYSSRWFPYPLRVLSEKDYKSISATKTPQGIMAVVRLPVTCYSSSLPEQPSNRILLLEDIQDPGNVGALIRTAAAFDFSGVILTEKCADPFSPKCVQASAGSVLSLWIRKTSDYLLLVKNLKYAGCAVMVADIRGSDQPSTLSSRPRLVLALGNETAGPSDALLKMADQAVAIPVSREKAESLNVAACGAICMYLCSQTV